MKIISNLSIIALFVTICNAVFGQDTTDSKWKIGISYSPNLCYRFQPDVQTSIFEVLFLNFSNSAFRLNGGMSPCNEAVL